METKQTTRITSEKKLIETKINAQSKQELIEQLTQYFDEQFPEEPEKISINIFCVGTIKTIRIA